MRRLRVLALPLSVTAMPVAASALDLTTDRRPPAGPLLSNFWAEVSTPDEAAAVSGLLKAHRPGAAAARRSLIHAAVGQGVPPARPGQPTAEAMLANMHHRLEHAKSPLADCFHQGLPLLTEMRDGGASVDPGYARSPWVDVRVSGRFVPEASAPVVHAFDHRGHNGLLWMTSIPAGDLESSAAKSEGCWQELCASRLTVGLDLHFQQIEDRLRSLSGAAPPDGPGALSAANGDSAHRPRLTHSGLIGGGTASVFLHIPSNDIRIGRSAAYLQVQTFWHP